MGAPAAGERRRRARRSEPAIDPGWRAVRHHRRVGDLDIGTVLRAVRIHRRLRQSDVAAAADVSHGTVSLIERGHLDSVSLRTLRAVAGVLEVRLTIGTQWRGGGLPRLLNHRHSAMHEEIAARFERLGGWTYRPEVSFSIYGERGIIDALAWHEASRSLLVIELKTEIVDVQELIGTMDRRRRLALEIVRDLKWRPGTVGAWVIVADSRTNRRHAASHRAVLRAAFPSDGHAVLDWLREPAGPMAALSFLTPTMPASRTPAAPPSVPSNQTSSVPPTRTPTAPPLPYADGRSTGRGIAPVRRVRRPTAAGPPEAAAAPRAAEEPSERGRTPKLATAAAGERLADADEAGDRPAGEVGAG